MTLKLRELEEIEFFIHNKSVKIVRISKYHEKNLNSTLFLFIIQKTELKLVGK